MASDDERRLRLRRFIAQEFLGEDELDLEDHEPLFSSGVVDSFSAVRLLAFLQTEFEVSPDGVGIEDLDTIEKCLALAK